MFHFFFRHHHSRSSEAEKNIMMVTTTSSSSAGALGAYNWTEIERYDATDLQLLLKDLEPHTKYEILLQAYNQFGRGPVAKIEATTVADGENLFVLYSLSKSIQLVSFFEKKIFQKMHFWIFLQLLQVHPREFRARVWPQRGSNSSGTCFLLKSWGANLAVIKSTTKKQPL